MITTFAVTRSYIEKPFWYQQFDPKQVKKLRGAQTSADFDAVDTYCLSVTTMKAMNFEDDIPSNPCDSIKHHYLLVLDLISIQDAI